jgi:hypothetical protein
MACAAAGHAQHDGERWRAASRGAVLVRPDDARGTRRIKHALGKTAQVPESSSLSTPVAQTAMHTTSPVNNVANVG